MGLEDMTSRNLTSRVRWYPVSCRISLTLDRWDPSLKPIIFDCNSVPTYRNQNKARIGKATRIPSLTTERLFVWKQGKTRVTRSRSRSSRSWCLQDLLPAVLTEKGSLRFFIILFDLKR